MLTGRARRARQAQVRLNIVYALAFAVLGAGTIGEFAMDDRQDERDKAELAQRVDDGDARAARSNAQTRRLIRQLRSVGLTPVVAPSDVPALPASATASDAQLAEQVVAYFDRYPIAVPTVDLDTLRAAVTNYLTQNPPPAGESASPTEIAAAVAAALRRNPPPAGADGDVGATGLSYVDVTLDDCALVFTRSDGQTRRVGPVCGPKGEPGEPGDPGDAGPTGPPGSPGVVAVVNQPACNDGPGYLASSTASYDAPSQTVTYACTRSTEGLVSTPTEVSR